ncbi:hypothetical protein Btru_065345 [Bulinus truncatus]|nr:hypothetical protein Btru_065345 [Bulinus truncatus]
MNISFFLFGDISCTLETSSVPWIQQLYLGDIKCTLDTTVVPWGHQLYLGDIKCTLDTTVVPWRHQVYLGYNSCTLETSVVPWRHQVYLGYNSCTLETSSVPWIQQLYLGDISCTLETSSVPWIQQLYLGDIKCTLDTTVVPWRHQLYLGDISCTLETSLYLEDIKLSLIVFIKYSGQSWMELNIGIRGPPKDCVPREIRANTTTTPVAPANPIPSDEVLQQMSHMEVQDFYHRYINSPQATCNSVVRMGKVTDGGWELCDDPLYKPIKGDCLVYSYGINFDFSFDQDMITYGCDVHAFDPSMKTAPAVYQSQLYFHATGVGAHNITVNNPTTGWWQLYTIAQHRRQHHHLPHQRQLDIVKMDVEGYEHETLMLALDDGSLDDVRQLAFETHVSWSSTDPTKEEYIKYLGLLRKVYDHGFRIYLTHRNYVWSAFESVINKGRKFTKCHEIHTVNIKLKNNLSQPNIHSSNLSFSSDLQKQKERELQQKIISTELAEYKALASRNSPRL